MTASDEASADAKTKVNVLLREYDTLRQEVISRTNNRFAITGVVGAILAFVCTQSDVPVVWRWMAALAALLAVLVFWWIIGYLMRQMSTRLMEIERRVNELLGDELLAWEHWVANRGVTRWLYPSWMTRTEHKDQRPRWTAASPKS